MAEVWTNWSENVRFRPGRLARPTSEQQVLDVLAHAAAEGRHVRVVGAGHSMPPLVETEEVLLCLDDLTGLIDRDDTSRTATFWAGTKLDVVGQTLHDAGLAMENYGDVNFQALAGAIGTGTHGTGGEFGVLSTQAVAVRLATASGEPLDLSEAQTPERFRAAQVALGSLGVFTRITLRVEEAFKLRRREWCLPVETALAQWDQLVADHRHCDFYWYPRRDEIRVRTLHPPDEPPSDLVPRSGLYRDETDWGYKIIPRPQKIKFLEMEYAIDAEAGKDCFREIRSRVLARHRRKVAWRILYRVIKRDDTMLSVASGRDIVTIATLHNHHLPNEHYFRDIEPIHQSFGGRPHWGKLHTCTPEQLRARYPRWDRFQTIRRELDPEGRFLNSYLKNLFGESASA